MIYGDPQYEFSTHFHFKKNRKKTVRFSDEQTGKKPVRRICGTGSPKRRNLRNEKTGKNTVKNRSKTGGFHAIVRTGASPRKKAAVAPLEKTVKTGTPKNYHFQIKPVKNEM